MEFFDVYDSHYRRIRRFVLALVKNESVADDVIQDTFLRVQKNLDDLHDPSRLSAWIHRIAFNLCQDHFRRVRSDPVSDDSPTDVEEVPSGSSVEEAAGQEEMGSCVRDKVDQLPRNLRTVLILHDVSELTHREIAEVLGLEVGTVRVTLHRARARLREILQQDCSFQTDERGVLVCEPRGDGPALHPNQCNPRQGGK
jgi:RNA polymerase sigma-70 factor (ECF subfamily)